MAAKTCAYQLYVTFPADESFSIKPLNESLGDEDNMVNTETGGQANVKRKRSDQEYGDLSEEEDGGNKENEVQDTLPDIGIYY